MSRSGYSDDYDEDGTGGLWRGAVSRAIAGKRGQAALKAIAQAMDAMPNKSLAQESLVTADGEFCTLGVLGHARGIDMRAIDADDWEKVAKVFNLAPAMVREIVFENDESFSKFEYRKIEICGPVRPYYPEYGEHHTTVHVERNDPARDRWLHMRKWVNDQIKPEQPA